MINYKHAYNEAVILDSNISISPSTSFKFLGVTMDDHLTFSAHVDNVVSLSNSKLYLLRQLKKLGMSSEGLKRFYTANIRSIISYAAPAWFHILSDLDKGRLERIQRSATKTILPDLSYEERLVVLELSTVSDFIICDISTKHFSKIANDPSHPLFGYVHRNTCRISSRKPTTFRPVLYRTSKRSKTFFQYFMKFFNK